MSEKDYSLREIMGNLLFPPHCLFCGRLIGWEETLCPVCRQKVSILAPHQRQNEFDCDAILWCAPYSGELRAGMEHFKFNGVLAGKAVFGAMLAQALKESGLISRVDAVTYVPMPQGRERLRGYNQAKLLAEYIAEELGLPLWEELLCRSGRETLHQATDKKSRRRLASESYHRGAKVCPPGAHILLVDDIITTGATMAACSALLRESGAAFLCGAAPLRTPWETSPDAPQKAVENPTEKM